MPDVLHIALIYGSTRPGRLCDAVGGWAKAEIERHGGFTIDLVDPAVDMAGDAALNRRLDRADGFIVVTPEYNHSFPAPLKALIDGASQEWQAKPAAFVCYGGVSGGLRAVEQLRLVFAELHTVGVRETVSFADVWDQFDAEGRLRQPERARKAMERMLVRLRWWATALKAARSGDAFAEAA